MLGIPMALVVFGAGEWATHKHLLHGLGRARSSRFAFHYHDHHQAVRRHGGYDPAYEGPPWSSATQAREALGLLVVGVAHAPLLPIAPLYAATIWYCLYRYRRDHRHAHLDPVWARDHLPHHYEHHLGDQEQNFGVVWSWVDDLAGTRTRLVGTPRELLMHARHAVRAATATAGATLRAQRRNPVARVVARAVRRASVARATK